MNPRLIFRAALFLAVMPFVAHAQVYRCDAEGGRKTYSDRPCGDNAVAVDVRPASGGSLVGSAADVKIVYYPVRGASSRELLDQLRTAGPNGMWAHVDTDLSYEMTTREGKKSCEIATVKAKATALLTWPKWVNRYEAPADVQAYFDREFRAVEYHQRAKVQINAEAAKELERMLRQLPAQRSCEALRIETEKMRYSMLAEVREKMTNYGLATNSGNKGSPYR